jgi:hypothetical protein
VLTRSSEGLGGLSRCIHRLFLDRLLPRNWSDAEPPILLNTWETLYFDVNHHDIVAMAEDVSTIHTKYCVFIITLGTYIAVRTSHLTLLSPHAFAILRALFHRRPRWASTSSAWTTAGLASAMTT